jgi:hypothetical protein
MQYFGEKSLSSGVSRILGIFWYIALAGLILAVLIGVINIFSISFGDPVTSEIAKGNFIVGRLGANDKKDWEELRSLPLVWKMIIMPYFGAVAALLLLIIKKAQHLFANFKNDVVFNKSNIKIITRISRLNIGFSILTANVASLLVSIVLFLLCEVMKKGAVLQEEHDFTV